MENIPHFKLDNMILQKAGSTHYFTIPKSITDFNLLELNKPYDLRIFGMKMILLNNRKIQTVKNGNYLRQYIPIPIENVNNNTLKHKGKYTVYFT